MVFAEEAEIKPEEPKTEQLEPVKEEPKPEESAYSGHNTEHSFDDGLELMRHREEGLVNDRYKDMGSVSYQDPDDRDHRTHGLDEHGPVILRTPGHLPHDVSSSSMF